MINDMLFYSEFEQLKATLSRALKEIGLESLRKKCTDQDLENICYVQLSIERTMMEIPEDRYVDFLKKFIVSVMAKVQIEHKIDVKEFM